MNIYLDYNENIFKEVIDSVSTYLSNSASNGKIKINITEKANLGNIVKQIEKTNIFSSVRFLIPIELLNVNDFKKSLKQKIIVDLQVIVNNKLTKNEYSKLISLSKIYRSIEVYDTSGLDQSDDFVTISNLIYINSKDKKDMIKFFYIVCDNKKYGCVFSSCMGKTLNIDKLGNVSFCPKYKDKTKFTSISEGLSVEKLYNCDSFKEILLKTVNTRKKCMNGCEYLDICQGGCPVDEDSCVRFKEYYSKALELKKSIFDKKVNLDYQPLYIKENILWSVSRGKK